MQAANLPSRRPPIQSPGERCSGLIRFLHRPWFAYGMIVALQFRAVWGMWGVKDVTFGDTASYFVGALGWYNEFGVCFVWSPLYTAFLGSFLFVTSDPPTVILLHRLVIVFTASLLVLGVLRRLLPPGIAWLMAAWWVVLPINFDTLYEIHLFAVLPLLASWLLLARPSCWARGAALAVLSGSSLLVRNEMSVAVGVLALACLVHEWGRIRSRTGSLLRDGAGLLAAYGVPLAIVAALCALALCRSTVSFSMVPHAFRHKHAFNIGQGYAFGYQQRHPDWTRNAWTEYRGLMAEQFGAEEVSLAQMLRSNPRAVFEHFAWNWRLTPNGLQVLLFNATAGTNNPDYIAVKVGRRWVLIPCVLVLSLWVAGLVMLIRRWRFWWRAWLKRRAMIWAGMFAVAACAPIIITTMRPRPSFLLGLGIPLMAGTGMSVFILTRHLRLAPRISQWLPAMMIGLLWIVPTYVARTAAPPRQPVLSLIQRMSPYADLLQSRETVLVQGPYSWEIRAYVGKGLCWAHDYLVLTRDWPVGTPLERFLEEGGVNALYLDDSILDWLERGRPTDAVAFLQEEPPAGWRLLGHGNSPGDRWRMYHRPTPRIGSNP
jgi:hypothetical protein